MKLLVFSLAAARHLKMV